jgi:hypothetical protein
MTITLNPQQLTNAAGTFTVRTKGGVQGMWVDDPAVRFQLVSGLVAPGQSAAIAGGMGITENLVTLTAESAEVNSVLTLASSQANLTGFTVFNQAAAMINTPSSAVPAASGGGGGNLAGGAISFFRLGSLARIWVACSSGVATAFAASQVGLATYWDYTNQLLLSSPGGTAIGVKVLYVDTLGNSMVMTNATTFTWNYAGYAALIQI